MYKAQVLEKYGAIESDKNRNFRVKGPKYHDYPDGEDLIGKVIATTRWSGLIGIISGLAHTSVAPYCKSFSQMGLLCLSKAIPLVLVANTFTVSTYYATRFRKTDDRVNYGIGGMAAGGVFGSLLNSTPHGVVCAFWFAIFGMLYKDNYDFHKGKPLTYIGRNFEPYYRRMFDFTLLPEKEGEWRREPPVN